MFAREMENGKCLVIRIYAEPFAYNIASCRVLEKAGFHYEETLRSNAVKFFLVDYICMVSAPCNEGRYILYFYHQKRLLLRNISKMCCQIVGINYNK